MRFTLYTADCCGNKQNKIYPHEITITSPADMKKSCRFDHVCARYTDGIRGNDNFMTANVIPMDCDNDCSETDFITAEVLDEILSDVAYVLVYSKSHMKEKDGKSARPRFHVYFPCSDYSDPTAYSSVKKRIHAEFPFFDGNALDAARFLFGSNGDVVWHEGSLTIEDYLLLMKQRKSIPEGQRNSTLSRFAGKLVKRLGTGEDAHEKFLQKAAECEPPLSDDELDTIWQSAAKFGKKIAQQADYIPPNEYGENKLPTDFSDVGQARAFVDMYGTRCATPPLPTFSATTVPTGWNPSRGQSPP